MTQKQFEGNAITILLVEDNAAHAEMVSRSLEGNRVANTIYHVTDGQQALDFLNHEGEFSDPEQFPRPGLVLLGFTFA